MVTCQHAPSCLAVELKAEQRGVEKEAIKAPQDRPHRTFCHSEDKRILP